MSVAVPMVTACKLTPGQVQSSSQMGHLGLLDLKIGLSAEGSNCKDRTGQYFVEAFHRARSSVLILACHLPDNDRLHDADYLRHQ